MIHTTKNGDQVVLIDEILKKKFIRLCAAEVQRYLQQ